MLMNSHHLRAIILKIQDLLSDNDRQRLHFFLGNDVPRRIIDDPSLGGTLNLMQNLFDQDKINERDFTFLINAFDEIHCTDAVQILREHMRQMQKHGQNQSVQSLTSILLQDQEDDDEEDRCVSQNFKLRNFNQSTTDENNETTITSNITELNLETIIVDKPPSESKQKSRSNLSRKTMKCLLLFTLLLIIVLAVVAVVFILRNHTLNKLLETKNAIIFTQQTKINNSLERIQMLTNQLNRSQQRLAEYFSSMNIRNNTKWKQYGITIAGGYGRGNQLNQLDHPWGIFVDSYKTIHIADCLNHRIIQWKDNKTNGQIIAGGNGPGNRIDQLNCPSDIIVDKQSNSLIICDRVNRRVIQWSTQNKTNQRILISDIDCYGLAMDNKGFIYISDYVKNEVRRWKQGETNGILIAGGNGKGKHPNQFNFAAFIFVDKDYSVYISDRDNDRVMKWRYEAQEGIVVAGGNGAGNNLNQLFRPRGVFVDHLDQIYVADNENHRIMRWCKGCSEGSIVVGGNGFGDKPNQFTYPTGLSFDVEGNLYAADNANHRIQKFEIDFIEINTVSFETSGLLILSAIYHKYYTWYQVYIDIDNNSTTGFSVQGIGADLLIENYHYYYYKGNNTKEFKWEPYDGETSFSIEGRKYVWKLAITNLKFPVTRSSQIVFGGSKDNKIDYSVIQSVAVTTTNGWTLIATGRSIPDNECRFIGWGDKSNLTACQKSCDAKSNCSGLNYGTTSKDCVLRQCSGYLPTTVSNPQYDAWIRKPTGVIERNCTPGVYYCGRTLMAISEYKALIIRAIDSSDTNGWENMLFKCLNSSNGEIQLAQKCDNCVDGGAGQNDYCQ